EFYSIIKEYITLPDEFEIHVIDLKTGKNIFNNIDFIKRMEIRNKIFSFFQKNSIPIIYRRIIKNKFENFCIKNYGHGILIQPYIMALPFICKAVDSYLLMNDAQGILIFDEQKEYYLDVEKSLKKLRFENEFNLKTTRIIEKGFFIDSKKSFGIQLVDFIAYYLRKNEEKKLGLKINKFDDEALMFIAKMNIIETNYNDAEITDWIKMRMV
ncbi:MAG TPA: hypothetical protein DC057_16365, partial [Spirochaetia bacterium]|nr:hypothetical protein [Spirochaetia bacterium]